MIHAIISDRDYKVHHLLRQQPKPKLRRSRPGTSSSEQLDLRRRVYADAAALLPVDFGQHRPRDLSAAALCDGQGPMQRLAPWIRRDLLATLGVVGTPTPHPPPRAASPPLCSAPQSTAPSTPLAPARTTLTRERG